MWGIATRAKGEGKTGGRLPFSKLFLLLFIFEFFVTLAYALITLSISSSIIRGESEKNNLAFLGKISNQMESRIGEINSAWIRLCNGLDPAMLPARIGDPYGRYLLQQELDGFVSEQRSVDSICFFYNGGRSVYFISYTKAINYVTDTANFFDRDIYHDFVKGRNLFELDGSRRISPVFNMGDGRQLYDESVLSFVRRFPVNSADSADITVLNVRLDYFLNAIDENYMPDGSIVLVSGSNGQAMSAYYRNTAGRTLQPSDLARLSELRAQKGSSFRIDITGETYIVTELAPGTGSRIYTLILPESQLLLPVSRVNLPVFVLVNVVLVLSAIFAKLIEMRFYDPILRILNVLKSNGAAKPQEGNELTQIDGYIHSMLDDKARQQTELERYFSFYRERMLSSLLTGGEIQGDLSEKGILSGGVCKRYCTIVIGLLRGEGAGCESILGWTADLLCRALKPHGQADIVKLNREQLCLLLYLADDLDGPGLKGRIEACLLEGRACQQAEGMGACVGVGIGGVYERIRSVSRSYAEAEDCLRFLSGSRPVEALDHAGISGMRLRGPRYPAERESSIISDIESCDAEALRRDLEAFCAELKDAGVKNARKYFLMLLYSVSRQLGMHNQKKEREALLDTALGDLDGLSTMEAMRQWASVLLENCIKNGGQAAAGNRELIEKVIRYLKTHFADDISLNSIANYVHLSPSYLGRLFREAAGATFTEYLIRVRMEEAARLLAHTDNRITDIVEKAGYFSIQSFNRAFHSYYDCSPSDYRKRRAGEALDRMD